MKIDGDLELKMRLLLVILSGIKKCGWNFVKYNFFCKNIIKKNGCYLYPFKNSIIVISKSAKLVLNGNLYINSSKYKGSKAESHFILDNNSSLTIENDTRINYGSTLHLNQNAVCTIGSMTTNVGFNLQCNKKIEIGYDCMFGRNSAVFDSSFHPTGVSSDTMEVNSEEVKIGNHVWIGAYAFVMQGSIIGDGSIIGSKAYVRGNIEAGSTIMIESDKPILSGMLWSRSMQKADLENAKKYQTNTFDTIDKNNKLDECVRLRVYDILSKNITSIDFNNCENLVSSGLVDSLGLITIVSLLEDEFGCEIPFTSVNAMNFDSVERISLMLSSVCDIELHKNDNAVEPLNLSFEQTKKPIVQLIMENAINNSSDNAIIANDKITGYGELANMIYSISKWLMQNGVQEGDRVAVQAIHEDNCIALYYAIQLIGAILVPVEKSAAQHRIKEIADDTTCKVIVSLNSDKSDMWYSYDDVRAISHNYKYDESTALCYPSIELPCEMIFTTGTTGKSKGVVMTHKHISWYAFSLAKGIEMKKDNRFLLTTPLNHAGGLRRTHLSLANGCCMVYIDGLSDLGKYFDYIEKYKVTSLYLPPVAIRVLLTRTKKELAKYKDQIDFVYSSSSPLPTGDCEELMKLLPKTRLYNAYEASETPGVSAYNYNTENALKGCLGKVNDGVEVAILTEDGIISTEANIQGQICVKSKMNMLEYYCEPKLTQEVWKDGWFISNDLGFLDESGNVYYAGRKGDVINIGGYKISPTDVEETALLSGLINECICIEAFDEFKVPFIKLLVTVNEKDNFNPAELGVFLTDRLEAYKIPRSIEIVDDIEKTFNGKINRKAYR